MLNFFETKLIVLNSKMVFLYYKGLLYILDILAHFQILKVQHYFFAMGHFGFNKIQELIFHDFWWLQLLKSIKEFVETYDICSCSKFFQHWPYHLLLQPFLVPMQPWSSLLMDFIIDIPISHSLNLVFVVVGCLTKMAHFIPCEKPSQVKKLLNIFGVMFIVIMDS